MGLARSIAWSQKDPVQLFLTCLTIHVPHLDGGVYGLLPQNLKDPASKLPHRRWPTPQLTRILLVYIHASYFARKRLGIILH
jgi:hypothetical protein